MEGNEMDKVTDDLRDQWKTMMIRTMVLLGARYREDGRDLDDPATFDAFKDDLAHLISADDPGPALEWLADPQLQDLIRATLRITAEKIVGEIDPLTGAKIPLVIRGRLAKDVN